MRPAARQINIPVRALAAPALLAVSEAYGNHGVGVLADGQGIGFACADVDQPSLFIDCRGCPDRRTGGAEQGLAVSAIADWLRVGHGIVTPLLRAILRVQRHDVAMVRATDL